MLARQLRGHAAITSINGVAIAVGGTVAVTNGTVTLNAGGTLTFTPAANYNGPASFTYTVTSGGVTETATAVTSAVNDPGEHGAGQRRGRGTPTAISGVSVADVDTGATLTTTLTVTNGTLAVATGGGASIGGSGTGTVTITGTPAQVNAALAGLTYTNTADYNGPATLTVQTTDGTATDTDTVAITVTPVVDITNDSASTNEDTPVTLSVLANDSFEGTPTITSINGVAIAVGGTVAVTNGTVTLNAGGTLTFTPAANYNGPASFTYTVTSGGVTETATAAITINAVNDAPVAIADSISTSEDDIVSGDVTPGTAGQDSDVDGDTLAVDQINGAVFSVGVPVTLPSGATVTMQANGTFDYNPNGVFNHLGSSETGTDSFTYRISDGNGGFSNAVVTISLTGTDDPLVLSGLSDGVGGTDASVEESDLPTGSTPAGTGETATGTFTISAPDGLTSLSVGGTTISAAALAASGTTPITIATTNGAITINGYNAATGTVSYSYTLASSANHSGGTVTDGIGLILTDVDGNSQSATLAILVLDDAPVASNDIDEAVNTAGNPSSVAYGNVVTGFGGTDPNTMDGVADAVGADVAASPVTAVMAGIIGVPSGGVGTAVTGTYGELTLNADGSYSFTPDYADPTVAGLAPGVAITDTFTYQITDSDGDTTTATLTVRIVGTPAIMGLGDGTVPGTDGSVLESDLASGTNAAGPGETLIGSFQAVAPMGVAQISVGGTVISAAALAASGTTPITISTTFGTIVINGYNATDGTVSYAYTLSGAQNHTGGAISDNITVSVTDSLGDTGTGTLAIAITDDAPVAAVDTASVIEDSGAAATGNVVGNDDIGADADATPVTGVMAGVGIPSGNVGTPISGLYGTLTLNADGGYSYAADNSNPAVNALQAGDPALSDVFTYQITDADGDTVTATLIIAITGANDAPVVVTPIADQSAVDGQGVSIPTAGNFSDLDGDTLGFSATGLPAGLTIDPVTGVISGTIDPAASQGGVGGVYTVVVTAADGNGGTVTDTFTYTVGNPPPVAGDDTFSTAEDTAVIGTVVGNDADTAPDSDALGYTLGTGTTNGTLSFNPDGTFTYTPNANFTGTDTFTYTVSDGQGGTDTATVTITVGAVNDAPVVVTPIADQSAVDGQGVSIPTAGNFSDLDGDTLGFSVTGLPAGLTIDPVTGVISGTIDPAASQGGVGGVYTVVVTVSDGNGGTVTDTFTYTVGNPPPPGGR